MAKCNVKMPDDFLVKLSRLGNKTDEIIERTLEVGANVVLPKIKSNLQAAIGSGTKYPSRATGELVASLGASPVKRDRQENHNIKIGFSEPRRVQRAAKGKRSYHTATNAMVANVLEYGRQGQPPKPFLRPARSATRKACIEAMQRKLEQEVDGI